MERIGRPAIRSRIGAAGVVATVAIAVAGLAVGTRGLPGGEPSGASTPPESSAGPTAPTGSASATQPPVSDLSDEAVAFIDAIQVPIVDSAGQWVLATAHGVVPLPWTVDDGTTVRTDFGRIVAATPTEDAWVFERLDVDKAVELLRVPAEPAELQATIDPTGTTLYFHAGTGEGDGGLYAFDIESGELVTLVPPEAWDVPGSRISLEWSASGTTLASSLCGLETACDIDVVTTATGEVRRLATRMLLRSTTDRFVLGHEQYRPFVVGDLVTDGTTTLAEADIAIAHEGYAVGNQAFLLAGYTPDRSEYRIVLADAASGETQLVASQPAADALLLTDIGRSSDFAVLAATTVTDMWAAGGGSLAVLDIGAKTVTADAIPIVP
jgi:hypothetical protein